MAIAGKAVERGTAGSVPGRLRRAANRLGPRSLTARTRRLLLVTANARPFILGRYLITTPKRDTSLILQINRQIFLGVLITYFYNL